MKTAVAVVCVLVMVAAASAAERNMFEEFRGFMGKFGKSYDSDAEWNRRFAVFKDNMKLVDVLNAANGSPVYGATKFADLAPEEFQAMYLNYKPAAERPAMDVYAPRDDVDVPASMDWRTKGVITPVKNQAQCGSCWAFSTTEEIESRWAQAGHKLIELSVQQIVSCDNVDQGCNGGDTVTAYQYVEKAGGLELGSTYPYTSGSGNNGRCKFHKDDIVANITGFKWATKDSDETVMKQVLGTVGPLSTCVDASSWQFYMGGVITSNCGRQLDHCVQTVGYGQKDGDDVWIVRNSWGTDWGYSGYLYIKIGSDLCGIADEPTYAECPQAN